MFSCDGAFAPLALAPPHLPLVDRLAFTKCCLIDFAKTGEYKTMNETDREKPAAAVEEKIAGTEGRDETLEMRRELMKRIAMGGFAAPAVLSTLLTKAAAQSVVVLPEAPN
jgi:hypothetical protein